MVWGDKRDPGPDENIFYDFDFDSRPVGGITFLSNPSVLSAQAPQSSSRGGAGLPVEVIAGAALAIVLGGGGVWYARRRRVR